MFGRLGSVVTSLSIDQGDPGSIPEFPGVFFCNEELFHGIYRTWRFCVSLSATGQRRPFDCACLPICGPIKLPNPNFI